VYLSSRKKKGVCVFMKGLGIFAFKEELVKVGYDP
jgi:hypothetical protein